MIMSSRLDQILYARGAHRIYPRIMHTNSIRTKNLRAHNAPRIPHVRMKSQQIQPSNTVFKVDRQKPTVTGKLCHYGHRHLQWHRQSPTVFGKLQHYGHRQIPTVGGLLCHYGHMHTMGLCNSHCKWKVIALQAQLLGIYIVNPHCFRKVIALWDTNSR